MHEQSPMFYVVVHALTLVLETLVIKYTDIATWCTIYCLTLRIAGVGTINKLARIKNTYAAHLESHAFLLNYGLSYRILLIKSVEACEKHLGLKEGYEHVLVLAQCVVFNVITSIAMRSALHHSTPDPQPSLQAD
jgi:hypothetical protein